MQSANVVFNGDSSAGSKRTAIQGGMDESVSLKRIKVAERMSDDGNAECALALHVEQTYFGTAATVAPPYTMVPDCDTRANTIPVRTPLYLLRRTGRLVGNRQQGSNNRSSKNRLHMSSDNALPFGIVDDGSGALCTTGAAFLYSGGKYPFSNIARCSADIVASQPANVANACVHTSAQHGAGNNAVEAFLGCCSSYAVDNQSDKSSASCCDGAHMSAGADQVDLVVERDRLVQELEEMTRQRDVAVLLAHEFHKQIVSASEIFGVLSVMGGA